MGQNRGEGGRYAARVEGDDVERALHEHSEPVATAGDLADVLNVSGETVRRHLTELHEAGRVGRKQVGSRAVVWWTTETEADEAPAAPLRQLVGMLDEDEADRARERSEEWGEEFDRAMDPDTGES